MRFAEYLPTNRTLHSENRPLEFIFAYQTFPPKKLSAKSSVKCSMICDEYDIEKKGRYSDDKEIFSKDIELMQMHK